jgi:hypothetical protein
MTIASAALLELRGQSQQRSWATKLNSTSATALERKGDIRWETHPFWGLRGFKYCRIDQSGGMTAGQVSSQLANVSIANITSGTTTTITTSGLTADILVDGLLVCIDDAGAAGAAPEGEKGRIVANTATLVTIDADDAFSVAPAVNDDFKVHLPFAVDDSADGDAAGIVQGVVMAAQDQYDYGWVQFYGIHPSVATVAAGTAIVVDESVVADAAIVTDGAADAVDLRIGRALVEVTSDTVLRETAVFLCCGPAFNMGLSAA